MKILSPYKSLNGYLHRFTLLKIGRLHIRIHSVLVPDGTPFLHTHPFHYASLVLSGGYTEKLRSKSLSYKLGSLILRSADTPHQITHVLPNTRTLFVTWETKDKKWHLEDGGTGVTDWECLEPGVYTRELYGEVRLCKFDRFWFKASSSIDEALAQTEPSIDQTTRPLKLQQMID